MPSPEYASILATVHTIRRRLLITRMVERIMLALIAAAFLAIDLLLARFLVARYPILGTLVACLPLLIPALFLLRPHRSWYTYLVPSAITASVLTAGFLTLLFLHLLPHVAPWMIPAASAAAFALAAGLTTPRITPRAAAIFVDQQAGLREKVSTALELGAVDSPGHLEAAFREPLLKSALAACTAVKSADVRYTRLSPRAYALAATAVIAAAAVCYLHPLPALAKPAGPNPVVTAQAAKLADILKELEKQHPEKADDPKKNEVDNAIRAAQKKLQENQNLSDLEAFNQVDKARAEVQAVKDRMDANESAFEKLEKSQSEEAQRIAKAIEALKNADTAAAQNDPKAGDMKNQAQKDLNSAAAAAGEKVASSQTSAKEKKDLANSLKSAAKAASGDKQTQDKLNDAAKAAESGDGQRLAQDVKDAGSEMSQQMSERQISSKDVDQALEGLKQAAAGGGSGNTSDEQQAAQENAGGSKGAGDSAGGNDGNQDQTAGNNGGGEDNAGDQGDGANGGGAQSASAGNGAGDQGKGQDGAMASAGGGNGPDGEGGGGHTNIEGRSGPGGKHHGSEIGRDGMQVRVYGADKHDTKGSSEKAQLHLNQGPAAGTTLIKGQADKATGTTVDYASVAPSAQQDATKYMDKQQIPPEYRDVIQQYYQDTVNRNPKK